jgi:hypothetical protein
MTMPRENFTFQTCISTGSMLKIASVPAATLKAMVKM